MNRALSTGQYQSIDQRVDQFRLYYQMKNDRPLLGFFVGSEFPLHRYHAAETLPEKIPLRPEDFNVEKYVDDCDRLFREHEACGGDFLWSASAYWGIPWLEASLGCNIFANHKTGSIYSEPPADFQGSLSIPDFDEHSPWMIKLNEFLMRMYERSHGSWPIGTTRMRGVSDLLSALYGGENFIYALLETPDEVVRICEKLTEFWIAFGQFQLKHIPLFKGGVGSYYYHLWAPEGTVWLQEDASAILSPSLYHEFIQPCDEKIVNSFPGCIIHQHPSGYYPLDYFLEMNTLALELHIDQGGPGAESLAEAYRKILDKKPLIIWGDIQDNDMAWIFHHLPPQGLAVNVAVRNKEEASRLWEKYIKNM